MVVDGMRQEMDEDLFDLMASAIHQPIVQEKPPQRIREKPDGTYDSKPNDPNYFQNYYQKNLKTPFTCLDCGRTISSKSNLSKHRHTKICEKHRNQ